MKVLSKLLGAILLLGCLAYISFVFGKYVLSSSLLKSIPRTDQIISSTPVSSPSTASDTENQDVSPGSPRVEMRVIPPSSRMNRSDDAGTNTRANPSDQTKTDSTDSNGIKKFDEGDEDYSIQHRSRHRRRHHESTDSNSAETSGADSATPNDSSADSTNTDHKNTSERSRSKRHKSTVSSSAPVRHLNQSEEQSDKSPVPQPEKSTSHNGSDAGDNSPIPKPE